jgi:hypothetical protein
MSKKYIYFLIAVMLVSAFFLGKFVYKMGFNDGLLNERQRIFTKLQMCY